MPKAEVELIKTGKTIRELNPQLSHACGTLDSDEYYLSITFCKVPSSDWIREFDSMKQLVTTDNVCGQFIKNIELNGSKYVSDIFGINRFSRALYDKLVADIKKLIDDVNLKFKE